MKQVWNIADRGGCSHDPVNGPLTAWVQRVEEVGGTVRAEKRVREAQTPKPNSRAGATPVCAALEPPQTCSVPTVTPGVAPALKEMPSVMHSSSDENPWSWYSNRT